MPDPTTPPVDAGDAAFQQWLASQSGSSNQIIQDENGNWVIVDKTTGKVTPLGIKGKPPTDQTKNRVLASGSSASDQYIVTFDDQGNVQTAPNPNYVPPVGKNTVPGTGTPPSYTPGQSTDPSDPLAHVGATSPGTPDLPVDVYTAQNNAKNDETARKINQQNADTASANSAHTIAQDDIQNQRQQANDALAQVNQRISNDLAAGRLSLDQAKQAYTEAHDQVSDWLTQRGQDIQSRGQSLNYLGNQSYVTKGQYESLQGAEGQLAQTGGVAFTPSPTPPGLGYDPAQLAASLAQQALGQTQQVQQPFSLGQAPAQPAGPGFVAPSFEQGGIQTNNPGTPPLAVAARR